MFCQKGSNWWPLNVKKAQICLGATGFLLLGCLVYSFYYEALVDFACASFALIDGGNCTIEEACARRNKALSLPMADFDKIMRITEEEFENSPGQKWLKSQMREQGLK